MKSVTLIAGMILLMCGQVAGYPSIVWSGVQDIHIGPGDSPDWLPSYDTWVLDLNTDGNGDFRFDFTEISDFVVATLADNAVTTQDHHPTLEIWDSWPLAEGVRIDAILDPVTQWGSDDYVLIDWESSGGNLVGVGPWAGVEYGYMGMQFHASSGIHYGWARISVYDTFPGVIVHDWAYETTPGMGIDTGVVPEPAALGLFALGLAAMLARHLRRASRR